MGELRDRLVERGVLPPGLERTYAEPAELAPAPDEGTSARLYGTVEAGSSSAYGNDGAQYSDYDPYAGGHDLNPVWSGRSKWDAIEEMRKSDAAVHSLLWMFKLPARQAEYSIEPFRDGKDPVDLLISEAVKAQFGLGDYEGWLDLTYDELNMQELLMLDFGSMFEEIVPGDPVLWRPYDAGADQPRIVRPIARCAPRYPATITEAPTDRRTGRLEYILQDRPGAEKVPGDRIVAQVLDRESDWFGTSLLRYVWGAWKMKKSLMIAAAIGWDRFAAGTPIVRYPEGDPIAKAEAIAIGKAYRLHERGFIALEGLDIKDGGKWGFEIVNGAQTLADPINLLRHYDGQIAHAGLQGFKELGNTATGSRATADVTQNPYWMAVSAIIRQVMVQRRKQSVRRFVDWNFGTEYATPELRVSKINAQDLVTLSQVIANLSSANLTFTDRRTQDDIRDRMDFSHLPDDVAEPLKAAVDQLPDDVGVRPTVEIPAEGESIARAG